MSDTKKKSRLIGFTKGEGAYGIVEFEIDPDILRKHAKVVSKSEPDVFSVFVNNITKKAREIFEI